MRLAMMTEMANEKMVGVKAAAKVLPEMSNISMPRYCWRLFREAAAAGLEPREELWI